MQQMATCAKTGFGGRGGGTEVFESEENKPVLTLEHPPRVVHQSFDEGPLRNHVVQEHNLLFMM